VEGVEAAQSAGIPFVGLEGLCFEEGFKDGKRSLGGSDALCPCSASFRCNLALYVPTETWAEEKKEKLMDLAVEDVVIGLVVNE
jgi:hypothetical protein